MDEPKDIMTIAEAAAYLRVAESTIRNLIARGVLRAHSVASTDRVVFRREDVEAVLVPRETGDA